MFKPMLAATLSEGATPRFPALISPKLDGIRAIVIDGVLVSRNLKPIPNAHCQALFGHERYNGLDGELIVGAPTDAACFRNTGSGVMSRDGVPNVVFYVFDHYPSDLSFELRLDKVAEMAEDNDFIKVVPHIEVTTMDQLTEWEQQFLAQGYEGAMLRHPHGPYKFGRSTEREGWLIKVKRFGDDEAMIVGFDEQMRNDNELTRDNLGRAKRTSHKENKTAKGTLGSLKVVGITGPYKGVEFDIGTGFDDGERQFIWDNQVQFRNKVVKFKYFPSGSKDKPRFPTYLGLRDKEDM